MFLHTVGDSLMTTVIEQISASSLTLIIRFESFSFGFIKDPLHHSDLLVH